MNYPAHDLYAKLYARYLKPARCEQLLDLAGPLQGRRVYDLCGGGGRLARLAAQRGAQVTLIDESVLMTPPPDLAAAEGLEIVHADVPSALRLLPPAHVLLCQQAVNYWLNEESAALVARATTPGGCFVFNTFAQRPSSQPRVKQYEEEGASFAELSWLVEGPEGQEVVEHVQVREGYSPHTTRFAWIAPERFEAWLQPHFDCHVLHEGATSVWKCVRRG